MVFLIFLGIVFVYIQSLPNIYLSSHINSTVWLSPVYSGRRRRGKVSALHLFCWPGFDSRWTHIDLFSFFSLLEVIFNRFCFFGFFVYFFLGGGGGVSLFQSRVIYENKSEKL